MVALVSGLVLNQTNAHAKLVYKAEVKAAFTEIMRDCTIYSAEGDATLRVLPDSVTVRNSRNPLLWMAEGLCQALGLEDDTYAVKADFIYTNKNGSIPLSINSAVDVSYQGYDAKQKTYAYWLAGSPSVDLDFYNAKNERIDRTTLYDCNTLSRAFYLNRPATELHFK